MIARDSEQQSQRPITNAMTVDVEDYFQVAAFESVINRTSWNSIPCRVERNVDTILALFEENDITATFFTLGWIAERYPSMVKRIATAGHEVASHGYGHERIVSQNPAVFRDDVRRSKSILEDMVGKPIRGYRAPSYSIASTTLWAHDVLSDEGYEYSSSVVPIKHDLYGIPNASRFPYKTADDRLLEIPISTVRVLGKTLNCGGGGWFRLFPYAFTRSSISRINEAESQPCVFYFHPWEIDTQQPRVQSASLRSKFRHYINLSRTMPRLKLLLRDFSWSSMEDAYQLTSLPAFESSTGEAYVH